LLAVFATRQTQQLNNIRSAPVPAVTVTTTATATVTAMPSGEPTSAHGPAEPEAADGATPKIRNTGDIVLIEDESAADLDSLAKNWRAPEGLSGTHEIQISYEGGIRVSESGEGFAVVPGPRSYSTCQSATAYESELTYESLLRLPSLCTITGENRHAWLKVVKVQTIDEKVRVAMKITVWSKPGDPS
jgi:hypothetical protein